MEINIFLLLLNIYSIESILFKCDFESPCNDLTLDNNWGLTDGYHSQSIDHDHTYNNRSGHYLFYKPQDVSRFQLSEIKTTNWIEGTTDRSMCLKLWYYTPRLNLPFSIQFVQGDDEQLTRIVASIPGKDPSINDWTQINVTLPAEKIKIFIRLNSSVGPLAFDDIFIDYCDAPRPSPVETLFYCDFESSCSDYFISLPEYFYQWSITTANYAFKQDNQLPSVDYTYYNGSGHYAWVNNYKLTKPGNVGYFILNKTIEITSNKSYCLNFQYYGYGKIYTANLKVYLRLLDAPYSIQTIWPLHGQSQYIYTTNRWTWAIINLPIGSYSILFRVDTKDLSPSSFALDNIDLTTCSYPPSQLSPYDSLLSFSCDFDNLTMCDMINGDQFSHPSYNFTVTNGDNIPNRKLGPTHDHTNNSSFGGFLYWNRELPFIPWDNGRIHPDKSMEQNSGLCIQFAYYVKSLAVNKNGTMLSISTGGCYGATLWYQSIDDSQGWKLVTVPVLEFACIETFYFDVSQRQITEVSVAFDDIQIDQCVKLNNTLINKYK